MRKKRKLQGRAVRDAEIAAELETPEVVEAIAGAALAAEAEAEAASEVGPDAEPETEDELAAEAAADLAGATEPETEPDAPATLTPERLEMIVESLLFAAERPLAVRDLRSLTGERDAAAIEAVLASLRARYQDRGIVLHDVAGGFQFRTHPQSSAWVQRLIAGRPVRLSRAQLETLAIIAYRQPITRPEVDEIRGVDSGSTLKLLMDRDLIRVLGKREEPGRPLIYGTSREFLEFFHLKDLRELPTLREFHELSEDSLREVEKLDGAAGPRTTRPSADVTIEAEGDRTAEPVEAFAADVAVEPEVAVDLPGVDAEVEIETVASPERDRGGDGEAERDDGASSEDVAS